MNYAVIVADVVVVVVVAAYLVAVELSFFLVALISVPPTGVANVPVPVLFLVLV